MFNQVNFALFSFTFTFIVYCFITKKLFAQISFFAVRAIWVTCDSDIL